MSTLTVQNIQGSSSSSNTISVASGHKISGAAGSITYPGCIIQSLYQEITAIFSTSSTSLVATGFSIAITPKFANSVIRSTLLLNGISANASQSALRMEMMRDGSSIAYLDDISGYGHDIGAAGGMNQSACYSYHDSPNTTSSVTYSYSCHRQGGSSVMNWNNYVSGNNRTRSTMILEEIAQ